MLFSDVIFGPVQSRRLGVSLGVNLLPVDGKICNFDCIYCECGWNADGSGGSKRFAERGVVAEALEERLSEMEVAPDVITFAGNGEPTLHPEFVGVVSDVLALRNKYAPEARVAVLSNGTTLEREGVRRALCSVDQAILKLDAAQQHEVVGINQPQGGGYDVERVVSSIAEMGGKCVIQTMFLRGEHLGAVVDNTREESLGAWLEAIGRIKPSEVMIYSLDRLPPCSTLERVSREELQQIASRVEALGVKCIVA